MAGYFTVDGDKLFYQAKVEGLSDAAFRLHAFCLCGPWPDHAGGQALHRA